MNKKERTASILMLTLVLGSVLLVGAVAATSPSDRMIEVIKSFETEIADIGTAVLATYGVIQVIQLGITDGDKSSQLKQIGGSFGLAIFLQGWGSVSEWIRNDPTSSSVGMTPDLASVSGGGVDIGSTLADPAVMESAVLTVVSVPL